MSWHLRSIIHYVDEAGVSCQPHHFKHVISQFFSDPLRFEALSHMCLYVFPAGSILGDSSSVELVEFNGDSVVL